eukprot:3350539-Rhodomonas_salina.6
MRSKIGRRLPWSVDTGRVDRAFHQTLYCACSQSLALRSHAHAEVHMQPVSSSSPLGGDDLRDPTTSSSFEHELGAAMKGELRQRKNRLKGNPGGRTASASWRTSQSRAAAS